MRNGATKRFPMSTGTAQCDGKGFDFLSQIYINDPDDRWYMSAQCYTLRTKCNVEEHLTRQTSMALYIMDCLI